jgi:hypothetical protein
MSDRNLAMHANAVNLARRLSVQNENDMLNALMGKCTACIAIFF